MGRTDGDNPLFGIGSGASNNAKLRIYFRNDGSTEHVNDESSSTIMDNNFHHVAVTFNNGTVKVYIDGNLDANTTNFNYTPSGTVTPTRFGVGAALQSTPLAFFTGTIDELGIWSTVLTQAQITKLYNSTSALAYSSFANFVEEAVSGTDSGFTGSPDNTDPFTSGQQVTYTVQSTLTNGSTYYWRVRGLDPSGSNTYGSYATTRSFTVGTSRRRNFPLWI